MTQFSNHLNNTDKKAQRVNTLQALKTELNEKAWLKPAEAAEMECVFDVISMKAANGQFGPQWKCEIVLHWDTIDLEEFDLGFDKSKRVFMSFPAGSRDDVFEAIINRGLLPMYNCIVEQVDTGKGNPFLDLVQLDEDDARWVEPPSKPVVKKRIGASKPAGVTRRKSGTKLVTGSNLTLRNAVPDDFDPFLDSDGSDEELP